MKTRRKLRAKQGGRKLPHSKGASRSDHSVFVIVWRYRVRCGAEKHFERIYGPHGAWARLFRKSSGYLGTQLFREVGAEASRDAQRRAGRSEDRPLRTGAGYVTIDMWRSRAAFDAFHRTHHGDYKRIDAQCESLTLHEEKLGAWTL